MINLDTQLQPELINTIDAKLLYLKQLQNAVQDNDIKTVYTLLNDKDNQEEHKLTDSLPVMVSDQKEQLAAFLTPSLANYIHAEMPFLVLEETPDTSNLYDVFIGDWWHARKLGTLNVLSVSLDMKDTVVDEWLATEKLSEGESIHDDRMAVIQQKIQGLELFLSENTKRTLELHVIEDQLAELEENKSGLFGRNDKATKDNLEKQQELLRATQKRVPEVEKELLEQKQQLLDYERDDALRQLEIKAIKSKFESITIFINKVEQLSEDYFKNLKTE